MTVARGELVRRRRGSFLKDHQPRIDRGAMTRIDFTVYRGRKEKLGTLLELAVADAPCWARRIVIGAGDGDKTASLDKAGERRTHMPKDRILHPPFDMRRGREWRVHQDHARPDGGIEAVVNGLGIERSNVRGGKQPGEQRCARRREFVERERSATALSVNGEESGAGRGFEDHIARRDGSGMTGDKAEIKRRRELLEGLAFFRAARLGRQERGELREHRELPRRIGTLRADRCGIFAEEKNGGGFTGFIRVFPDPGSFAVGAAENLLKRGA